MILRDYQQRSIDMLINWLAKNSGNPCVEMPTGSGKSHVIAALCKYLLSEWPELRILMLTHVKELIEQNYEKILIHLPDAPAGIYSAGIGRRDIDSQIIFGGIQSLRKKHKELGHVDLIIIDECHLVNALNIGGYRTLIENLTNINPNIKIIGYTATPYRLKHGYIHEGENTLFNEIIKPTSIEELIYKGHLSTLRSKKTEINYDVSSVRKNSSGDYKENELQFAVDTNEYNKSIVREVIDIAKDKKAWLFFCVGVKHAQHIKDELLSNGIIAECVLGNTPKNEREKILNDFKSGKIRALTNANVLTTGFDYPDIDLIVMLRPTLSASLYVQMAGRGMRIKSHTDHCTVLDFAGVIKMHGPITNVRVTRPGEKGGEAPTKVCENCNEIVHASVMICPSCGFEFKQEEKAKELKLHDDDIMGKRNFFEMDVSDMKFVKHVSGNTGKELVRVNYYGGLNEMVSEYYCVNHDGRAGEIAMRNMHSLTDKIGISRDQSIDDLKFFCDCCNYFIKKSNSHPKKIKYTKNGKFYEVVSKEW